MGPISRVLNDPKGGLLPSSWSLQLVLCKQAEPLEELKALGKDA